MCWKTNISKHLADQTKHKGCRHLIGWACTLGRGERCTYQEHSMRGGGTCASRLYLIQIEGWRRALALAFILGGGEVSGQIKSICSIASPSSLHAFSFFCPSVSTLFYPLFHWVCQCRVSTN
jgi:hypothetical protein